MDDRPRAPRDADAPADAAHPPDPTGAPAPDGASGARFLVYLKELLESPGLLAL